jgi:hypothetical protein
MPEPRTKDSVEISLIVCTRNRASQLALCLEAIRGIEFEGAWEVVVVDNGSTDNTPAIIEAASAAMPVSLIKVVQPMPGVSRGRNAGIAASTGRFVAFTDDDCYVERDFLTEAVRAFDDDTVGYATGRVELHDPTDAAVTIDTSRTPRRIASRSYVHVNQLIGANLVFRRSVLDVIGGFDELLGPGTSIAGAEDTDLAARASAAGWEGVYRPEMAIRHHHRRKEAERQKLYRAYQEGQGAYVLNYLFRGDVMGFLRGIAAFRWSIQYYNPPRFFFFVAVGATKFAMAKLSRAIAGAGA